MLIVQPVLQREKHDKCGDYSNKQARKKLVCVRPKFERKEGKNL